MESDDVGHKEFSGLCCTWEFREGHVVDRLGKAVNNGKDSVIAPGHRKTRDEVQGDMGPRSTGHR